ncbi:contactin-associated protein-like 5, partial [Notothenia coriiceps]|uniref:Contactin-associated protein-like 5 n=1 Tax=Notothenia coriiceps TaxID=8208 RepID=A0A6I9NKA8_9TELE
LNVGGIRHDVWSNDGQAPRCVGGWMDVYSVCFSGGTASRQKGFRGCIRSLQLNGVPLDLEERAEITPGVRPGCPGHCSSYGSLCQNQGRCVERASGFHCDCGLSAHTGAFCHTELKSKCYSNLFLKCLTLPSPDSEDLDPDLSRLASLGFSGCLSVVRFNSISPLKAALLHPDSSPVTISGPLLQSSCGSSAAANPYAAENTHHLSDQSGSVGSGQPLVNAMRTDSALIGGVIAVVIFVVVTVLAITARFLYRRKETYRNQEVKGVKQEDSQDFHFNNQTDPQNVSSENPKEYFI